MTQVKLLTIIGARPQIIKASAISRVISNDFADRFCEVILHTGQHYDERMSGVFIKELGLPEPDYNLGVGSSTHARQTAAMMEGIEDVIGIEKPDWLIVYGDTNSTLAGALAGSKLGVPVVHIEAGLRSYNKSMPEEVNRLVADHVSTMLFAPTSQAIKNLVKEGFTEKPVPPFTPDNPGLFHSGDIMYDNSIYFAGFARERHPEFLSKHDLQKDGFILATLHRSNNTDIPDRLRSIFRTILEIGSGSNIRIVVPLHPRTTDALLSDSPDLYKKLESSSYVSILPPVSYLEMILLEKNAMLVMTDSGGVQKESHFFGKPCIVFRKETEWTELVENGTVILADAWEHEIKAAFDKFSTGKSLNYPSFYGNGNSSSVILKILAGKTI